VRQALQKSNIVDIRLVAVPARVEVRPCVRGKFLFVGDEKLYIRGVTYGPFRPEADGSQYHTPAVADRDFALMVANGINAVRTYTVPPRWLLDAAHRHGLRVMVGLPWEQHITFLDDAARVETIKQRVREGVRACAGHPAVLCYSIGNEIPASIVRWHGKRKVERFLHHLYRAAKSEDPEALFTYVNYPTTEYLQLPFLDLVCFNVYLESQERFDAYLARLHNLAGDRPLVMAEIGLDSRRNGEDTQAHALDWQVRTAFASGCAGLFLFAWTDEWHRGGCDIDDWDFGLTTRDRHPKPALQAMRKAFADPILPAGVAWPRISVVICTYNGQRTIAETLGELEEIDYPDYEVIVVDDGSTDATAEIARQYNVRVISTENRGLSAARNTGLAAATGEIVAYIDDDAYPDPQWLRHLAWSFLRTDYTGVGGPNIPPGDDGRIADCVANSPGGPIHVLLSDREAEHIPGCNMAFRGSALQAIGGFDPQFRAAGDDVDVCWRIQHQGGKLGFNPAAVVFHHRRNSVKAYWKQQMGYGKAEALLERKWPEKYNAAGHLTWAGRVYSSRGLTPPGWRRGRIYQGTWGSAPYQSLYQPAEHLLRTLPLMPEWYLVIVSLAVVAAIGALWKPLLWALPLLMVAIGGPLAYALMGAAQAAFPNVAWSWIPQLKVRGLTFVLHILQPLTRLWGRMRNGLHPWRQRGVADLYLPRPRVFSVWSEEWHAAGERLQWLEEGLRADGALVLAGGAYDGWDLQVQGGILGGIRTRLAIEEHGGGKQMLRFGAWPRCSVVGVVLASVFTALCAAAALDRNWDSCVALGGIALLLASRMLYECSIAMGALARRLKHAGSGEQ
jgi:GT2 family glycosyltransferase